MAADRYDDLDLPENPTTEGLEALIGEAALAQLSIDFGGSVISIPTKVGKHSPIAFSIGVEAMQKLVDVWGGMQFSVPLNAGRKGRILRLRREGKSINLICRMVGVTRPTVYRILAEEDDKRQLALF